MFAALNRRVADPELYDGTLRIRTRGLHSGSDLDGWSYFPFRSNAGSGSETGFRGVSILDHLRDHVLG